MDSTLHHWHPGHRPSKAQLEKSQRIQSATDTTLTGNSSIQHSTVLPIEASTSFPGVEPSNLAVKEVDSEKSSSPDQADVSLVECASVHDLISSVDNVALEDPDSSMSTALEPLYYDKETDPLIHSNISLETSTISDPISDPISHVLSPPALHEPSQTQFLNDISNSQEGAQVKSLEEPIFAQSSNLVPDDVDFDEPTEKESDIVGKHHANADILDETIFSPTDEEIKSAHSPFSEGLLESEHVASQSKSIHSNSEEVAIDLPSNDLSTLLKNTHLDSVEPQSNSFNISSPYPVKSTSTDSPEISEHGADVSEDVLEQPDNHFIPSGDDTDKPDLNQREASEPTSANDQLKIVENKNLEVLQEPPSIHASTGKYFTVLFFVLYN